MNKIRIWRSRTARLDIEVEVSVILFSTLKACNSGTKINPSRSGQSHL